jgi:hypothetical protein
MSKSSTAVAVAQAVFLLFASAPPATAADIWLNVKDGGPPSIHISGRLVHEDGPAFARMIQGAPVPGVVYLDSPGGKVAAALTIGAELSKYRWATAVKPDATCSSACGLIWLAGFNRWMANTSKVGFHAVWVNNGEVSPDGNATVGAYLSKLGFSYKAIVYVTSAPPSGMTWLDIAKAKDYDIAVRLLAPAPLSN